jgi:hypothetical protein
LHTSNQPKQADGRKKKLNYDSFRAAEEAAAQVSHSAAPPAEKRQKTSDKDQFDPSAEGVARFAEDCARFVRQLPGARRTGRCARGRAAVPGALRIGRCWHFWAYGFLSVGSQIAVGSFLLWDLSNWPKRTQLTQRQSGTCTTLDWPDTGRAWWAADGAWSACV